MARKNKSGAQLHHTAGISVSEDRRLKGAIRKATGILKEFRALIDERRCSQARVARETGIAQGQLSRYLTGLAAPSVNHLEILDKWNQGELKAKPVKPLRELEPEPLPTVEPEPGPVPGPPPSMPDLPANRTRDRLAESRDKLQQSLRWVVDQIQMLTEADQDVRVITNLIDTQCKISRDLAAVAKALIAYEVDEPITEMVLTVPGLVWGDRAPLGQDEIDQRKEEVKQISVSTIEDLEEELKKCMST